MTRKDLIALAYWVAIKTMFSKVPYLLKMNKECLDDNNELFEMIDQDRLEALYIEFTRKLEASPSVSNGVATQELVTRLLPFASEGERDIIESLFDEDQLEKKLITRKLVYVEGAKIFNALLKKHQHQWGMGVAKYLNPAAFKKAVLRDDQLRTKEILTITAISKSNIYQIDALRKAKLYKN